MTAVDGTTVQVDAIEELAEEGLRWLLGAARETEGGGLAWQATPSDDEVEPTLYSGTAGIVPVLLEAWRHFGDDSYAEFALRAGRSTAAAVDDVEDDSLYFGRTGMAYALRVLHEELGDPVALAAADRALALVRARFDGERWGELFELMGGNAGIGLAALAAGDTEFAVLALACDRIAEGQEAHDFAGVLVADLAARAIRDTGGARWSNFAPRENPSDLEPHLGWAQGSAGIVRELLRFVRVSRHGDPRYAFTWPDQPPVRAQATEPIRPTALVSPS